MATKPIETPLAGAEQPETIHHVRPKGWEKDPDQEIWRLADLDYTLPPVFLQQNLIYRVSDQTDQHRTIQSLRDALALTLSQCRTLSGVFKAEAGEVSICKIRDGSVPFIVRPSDPASPSYADLEAAGFPPLQIARLAGVEDMHTTGISSLTSGRPTTEFRATWIPGGLLLTVGYHHYSMDDSGFAACVKQWAKNCIALANNAPAAEWEADSLNRKRLDGTFVPPEERATPPPRPLPDVPLASPQPMRTAVLHLSHETVASLKVAAAGGKEERVSTYDAVAALLWRVHTRARTTMYDLAPGEFTLLGSAINLRDRYSPPLHRYLQANGCTGALTPPVPVLDAIDVGGLSKLASLVRQSHAAVTEEVAMKAANMVAGLKDKKLAALSSSHVPRFVMAMSDGRSGDLYDLDFGFGSPVAIRNVYQPGRPCSLRYLPVREDGGNVQAGIARVEAEVPVEIPCLQSFLGDPELLSYAKIIAA